LNTSKFSCLAEMRASFISYTHVVSPDTLLNE
jgi:hypothetical protein